MGIYCESIFRYRLTFYSVSLNNEDMLLTLFLVIKQAIYLAK